MGGSQSQDKEDAIAPKIEQKTTAAQHQKVEDLDHIRNQRAAQFQKKLEEQKRAEALKKQQVIDFKQMQEASNSEVAQVHEAPQATTTNTKLQHQEETKNETQQQPGQKIQQQLKADLPIGEQSEKKVVQSEIPQQQKPVIGEHVQQKLVLQKPTITKEQRVHNFISDVFQITNDGANKGKTFLYEYAGDDKLFKIEYISDIIECRLPKCKDENKFIYLIQCFRRLDNHLYVKEKIIENAEDIKETIVTYFNTCLNYPDTFNLTNNYQIQYDNDGAYMQQNDMFAALMGGGVGSEKLSSNYEFSFTTMQNHLWEASEKEDFIKQFDFMKILINVIKDEEDQCQMFYGTIFDKLFLNINTIKIEKFRTAEVQLETIKILFEQKEAQQIFVNSPQFYSEAMNGKDIQQASYFGRYLSFTALPNESQGFKTSYFKGGSKMSKSGQQRQIDNVSDQLYNLHGSLQNIMSKLLKNKDCKERVLEWMRASVYLNLEKQKMYTQMPVASDGFILNLLDLILQFCNPFTSKFTEFHQHFPKINCLYLINDNYLKGATKIDKVNQDTVTMFLHEQNMNFSGITQEPIQPSSLGDDAEDDQLFKILPPNFVTECLFQAHILIDMMAKKLEKTYDSLVKELNKAAHEKDYQLYEERMGSKMCYDAHIFGKNVLAGFRSLFTFTGSLLISINSNKSVLSPSYFEDFDTFQKQLISLPIEKGDSVNVDFASLPQCLITNMVTMPKLFRIYNAESYYGKDYDLNIQVATNIAITLNKKINNPHARCDSMTFLVYFVPQSFTQKNKNSQHDREDTLYKDIFFTNFTLKEHLMEAIITVYIDAERTDYYSKFSYRYYSSLVMEYIWQEQYQRDKFVALGHEKPGLFIEYCNFLIGDLNTLLFEGLLELEEIKNYEMLESSGELQQMDQESREQKQAAHQEHTRRAKGDFQLSQVIVQLLAKVTITCQEPFISEELGERFANAINYCLDSLVSQKGLKLKVNNPEQYNFDPRELLLHILNMYANMSVQEKFLQHVIQDTRSYHDETFTKAVKIINNPKKGIQLSQDQQEKFENMVKKLVELNQAQNDDDQLFDDAPEEFLDPIMSFIMKDPVELPSSKSIIDYMTIKKHLMNDPHDPFNRAPLTLDQLIPRPDIKQQIDEFKEKKRAEKMAQKEDQIQT